MVKEAPQAEATQALTTILGRVAKTMLEYQTHGASEDATTFARLFGELRKTALHVRSTLGKAARDPQRLYAIGFLEALLSQHDDPTIVNDISYDQVVAQHQQTQNFLDTKIAPLLQSGSISRSLIANQELLRHAQHGVQMALTETVETNWLKFLDYIAQQESNVQKQVTTMINTINSLDMMPLWLHFEFNPVYQASGNACLDQLQESLKTNEPYLQEIKALKSAIDDFDPTKFQEPANYVKQAQKLDAITATVISNRFLAPFTTANSFTQKAAQPLMLKVIELFDHSIKALKTPYLSTGSVD